jgi:hypothetical protein
LSVVTRVVQTSLNNWIDFAHVETLTGLDTYLRQLCDDRLVGQVRRMELEQFSGVGKEVACWHSIHLELRRGLHVHRWIRLKWNWFRRFAPSRQGRDFQTCLYLVNRVVIRWSIGLNAANDPDVGGRSVNALRVLRQPELVYEPIAEVWSPS